MQGIGIAGLLQLLPSCATSVLEYSAKSVQFLLYRISQTSHRHRPQDWREKGAGRGTATERADAAEAFQELASFASSLNNSELFWVSRAFTHFLAIANAAEGHHRSRSLTMEEPKYVGDIHALSHKNDSCGGLLPTLLAEHSKQDILNCLLTQQTELVLTAHPTEVNRRTILDKQRRVQAILTQADVVRASGRTTLYMQDQLNDALEREIASLWQSDEVSRYKPSPQEEAERGTLVVETVLWEAVPVFLRKLNATMVAHLDQGLPLDAAPVKFASWMGGDRDGNPNVTERVTREVCLTKRLKAATLFERDLTRLRAELSITTCSDELRVHVRDSSREPYRDFLTSMIFKLSTTVEWAEQELGRLERGQASTPPSVLVYLSKQALMEDLLLIHRSLCQTGNLMTANGFLTDIIRNVSAFGLTLVPLDIRQESDRHAEALDAITRYLGLGSYEQWDEPTKINWLISQLSSNRPLLRAGCWHENPTVFSATSVDTLETFRMIADQYEESLGAYVISQATSASDVLAVLILQRDAGVQKPLRVVPLFETLDDLKGAAATMETLFSLPAYVGSIGGKQEVMIGYSDSAKDAGRLAASWAQYETQEKLAQVAKKYNVELTFFHGKGGTVARGGNPATFKAILAHAPDTINGRFRVTEQGEMITRNFGHADRAERTLDIYTAALLAEKLTDRPSPTPEWRAMMGKLSDISCAAYRRIVREDTRFVPYFRSATPELELASLNIGSRPAKRKPGGGVESLRAIPWIFAWTQTRLNLPVWLGVGEAVGEVLGSDEAATLRDMYRDFGSFKTTIDLVEMVLSKSEPSIAQHYDKLLVSDPKAQELGQEVRSMHTVAEKAVLDLTEHETLTDSNHLLRRALVVRNPYVDCLNVLQAETLKRIRSAEGNEEAKLKDALMTTITGIANGMGNTG
jgi:phosphoenolpyruvate carboxylase